MLFGVDLGELGPFKGNVGHEAFDVENKRNNRVIHLREVDTLTSSHFHYRHIGINPDLPPLARPELF
jgi:hypothetical protein